MVSAKKEKSNHVYFPLTGEAEPAVLMCPHWQRAWKQVLVYQGSQRLADANTGFQVVVIPLIAEASLTDFCM